MTAPIIQTLRVRARDEDPTVLWVEGSECPVVRYRKPFPPQVKVGSIINCYGDGTIGARVAKER